MIVSMNIQGNTLVKGVDEPHVVIPEGVEIIGEGAFLGYSRLTSVEFPSTLTSIEVYAFYECTGLTSVVLPGGLTSIGMGAFQYCSGLTSVVLPEGLTSIGESAFIGCTGLTLVDLSATSLTSIGRGAFYQCSGLTSVTFPEGLTSIGGGAFYQCSRLTSIVFPSTLTSIGYGAFDGSGLTSVVLPEGLTSIGGDAFYECTGLTSVTFPEGLTSIGQGAFTFCSGLTSVELPSSLTSIGDYAFRYCTRLRVLVPPCQVQPGAFTDCFLVLNASGRNIPESDVVLDPRIIGLRQRLFAIWLQNIRRQGKMRQTSKGYGTNTGASQSFVDLYSADEKVEVVRIWREIKQILDPILMWFKTPMERTDALNVLFRRIIAGGRKLVKMKSYLNQPKETKVFKKVFEDLGIEEPRRFRNWQGRLESQLRF